MSTWRRGWLPLVLGAALLAGASATVWILASEQRQAPRPPLYGEADIARLEAGVLADVEALTEGLCDPGADVAILRLFEPEGALAECTRRARSAEVAKALVLPERPAAGAGGSDELEDWRPLKRARPLEDPRSRTPMVTSIERGCDGLAHWLAEAVERPPCGPYRPGARPEPDLMPVFALARAVAVEARELARAGDADDALRLLVDGLSVTQHLCRRASWLPVMVSVAASEILASQVALLLDGSITLEPVTLAEGERQLERMLDAAPHPATILSADATHVRLYLVLPSLQQPGWAPPGGWPHGFDPSDVPPLDRDQAATALAGMAEVMQRQARACPPNSALRDCYQGLVELDRALAFDRVGVLGRVAASLEKDADALRLSMVEGVVAQAAGVTTTYVGHCLRSVAVLEGLRGRMGSRLHRSRGDRCEEETYETRVLGGKLRVEASSEGSLVLHAPSWLAPPKAADTQDLPLLDAPCSP